LEWGWVADGELHVFGLIHAVDDLPEVHFLFTKGKYKRFPPLPGG